MTTVCADEELRMKCRTRACYTESRKALGRSILPLVREVDLRLRTRRSLQADFEGRDGATTGGLTNRRKALRWVTLPA